MYETFPSFRQAAANKPNLLIRICGQPPQFSPEQQLLNWLSGVMTALLVLYAVENWVIDVPLVWPNVVGSAFFLAIYLSGRLRRAPLPLLATVTFGFNLLLVTLAWTANDGIDGSTLLLYLSTLVCIMGVFQGRARVLWTVVMFAHVAAMVALQLLRPDWITPYASTDLQRFDMVFTFSTVAIFLMGYVGVNLYNLEERRKAADGLLLNILPGVVADRLKYSSVQVIAEHHPEASILFADIVGFTPLSAGLEPIELVELLNSVFSYFDTLADKYQVEKIKTIGDCYMAAAGVPTDRADHAQVLTRMALEMRDHVCTHSFGGQQISLRIGLNSGPVVAGVIGYRKFAYDLWGDAVNTASRMESHGQSNVIQITGNTYRRIKDAFICEPQGTINVKGKGPMDVWHVMGARA